jgi:pimeloyl-ACP methyl ester carboxylesterase
VFCGGPCVIVDEPGRKPLVPLLGCGMDNGSTHISTGSAHCRVLPFDALAIVEIEAYRSAYQHVRGIENMEPRQSRGRRALRIIRKTGVGFAIALVILGIAGAAWNYLATRHDRNANPPPGQLLLESGRGDDFTVWGKVQPALSRVTRTCSYDRAGFGWSDSQPGARDGVHIADQLHALLIKAGITAPVVLVGHSIGGIYVRMYASKFPQKVAGLVLVDSSSPNPLPSPPFASAMDEHSNAEFMFVKAAVALGVARLMGQCDAIPKGLEAYAGWIKGSACDYPQLDEYVREYRATDDSHRQGATTGPFGKLPILVLSQDPKWAIPDFLAKRVTPKDWRWASTAHDREQEAFLKLSTNSRRVIATGSGHYIQYERPDVLIQETAVLIRQIRSDEPSAGHTK